LNFRENAFNLAHVENTLVIT